MLRREYGDYFRQGAPGKADPRATASSQGRRIHRRWRDGNYGLTEKYRLAIAGRTIIAAAKGGQLRHLNDSMHPRKPFAIRALLPFWVLMEEREEEEGVYCMYYGSAAILHRPFLSHVSRWLGAVARKHRQLSAKEIQELHGYFQDQCMPEIRRDRYRSKPAPQPITLYLPWLAEDAALAQRVSDAWNTAVARGEEDLVKCACEKCASC